METMIEEWIKNNCKYHGYGSGYGDGSGSGISYFNNNKVFRIDCVSTIINSIKGNVAKGYILGTDFTLKKCFIVKGNGYFAHGETLRDANSSLLEKIFSEMDTETAIEEFVKKFPDLEKKYPVKDFYKWHNILTGSCEIGRKQFALEHNISIENDELTVNEFIELTINSYGGDVIEQLKERICKQWKDY